MDKSLKYLQEVIFTPFTSHFSIRRIIVNSRERVVKSLNFEETDRVPKDLGGMRSTGISCFAYPHLVKALGLPPRPTRIHDTVQMLAIPDIDILDALGCDVIFAEVEGNSGVSNGYEENFHWHDYSFNGRLNGAQVPFDPSGYTVEGDGTIVRDNLTMPPQSCVFSEDHGGQAVDITGDLPKIDLNSYRKECEKALLKDDEIRFIVNFLKHLRNSSDRAIFFSSSSVRARIGISNFFGIGIFPLLCMLEPEMVREAHEIGTQTSVENAKRLFPEIDGLADVFLVQADDWGTQNAPIASPNVYKDLFLPFYKRLNDQVHESAPDIKTFLHSCGAVYSLLDLFIDSGFDIINPVQWSAGDESREAWKEKVKGRASFWGGGVDSQHTLPLGSIDDVRSNAFESIATLKKGGGFVFCNIHNILAEIEAEKVIAMYEAINDE